MSGIIIEKTAEYVLNHCTKYLARENGDARHSYLSTLDGQPRASVAECWRFPVVDGHDGSDDDQGKWNDVTFIFVAGPGHPALPQSVQLVTTCHLLYEPLPLRHVAESIYWAITLMVRRAERHRYRFVVDGAVELDWVNPQTEILPTGDVWSSFFTWTYSDPISFERWEIVLLDRLTRYILPFECEEGRRLTEDSADGGTISQLHRLAAPVGATNYIDKLVAREERHRLHAYKTCLAMLARILSRREPGTDIESMPHRRFAELCSQMARYPEALFADGWDRRLYRDPAHFLWLLRRHTWTGAFAHPKYGGNTGCVAWDWLAQTFLTTETPPSTAFDWRRAIEPPLGTSEDYRG